MRAYSHNAVGEENYSGLLERKNIGARLGKGMSDKEIRNFARSVIRSSGGQCDSLVLFSEMYIVGVSRHQFQSAIKDDFEIEVTKDLARLIEK